MPTKTRTARADLQRALGGRGVVMPYVVQTDRRHPYVGWYAQITTARPGCRCGFCSAGRNGGLTYVGYHRRDAIEAIAIYKHEHPEDDG